MKLANRVALVTGGAGGIGQAIGAALAAEGAQLALHYHRGAGAAAAAAAGLQGQGRRVQVFGADLTDPAAAVLLAKQVVDQLGGVDILINNAGITIGGKTVLETGVEEWRQVMAVNLDSVFYLTRAVLPQMQRQGYGRIVNISSNVINTLPGGSAAYGASKSALVALTKVLSKEVARDNIRVNAVAPGMIDAGMGQGALARRSPELARRFLDTIPQGRAGSAEEVAAAVVFLCTEEASYVTGQCLNVNGGDRTESYQ
ncbi:MAG: glucose 1-dehydrogenase [Candidatus Latescibacteria bacterium]|nr:glucose 1-dehydrogenase [Candidatus Latescibacterota bacterium]